jgi:uncharacterized protein
MRHTRLRLDPWPAEYESSFQVDEFEPESEGKVETDVEGIGWRLVEPQRRVRPEPLHFVDGVRRVEARIILDDESGRVIRGLFGSVGVGTVRIEESLATFQEIRIRRCIVVGAGVPLDDKVIAEARSLKIGNADLVFEPVAVPENTPAAAVAGLQNCMRDAEARLAEELSTESACVFADGPLTYFSGIKQPAVGVIKRLIEPYLPVSQFELVRQLRTGQRTPLFVITKAKYDRYSWYLRVGMPRAMDHDVAGVLRLEVRSGIGLERAVEIADLSASCLPGFAGDSFRDPRSPQNLLPIGSLENELRHRLGDSLAIRRAIEVKLFGMSNQ